MIQTAMFASALLLLPAQAASAAATLALFTTSGCACCVVWAKRMREAGFTVTVKDVAMGELMRIKLAAGITPKLAACHTAKLGSYALEGHVPSREIYRLLAEQPDAAGLAVPAMPVGSPGMESGVKVEAYAVLLVKRDGSTVVYANYAAAN